MVFFTSDLHLHHNKDFIYKPRGFENYKDHDATLIHYWNSIVEKNDIVYILGDLMLENNDYGIACIKALNGNLVVFRGNHDTDTRWNLYKELFPKVVVMNYSDMLKYGKWNFYLSHYPTKTGNYDDDIKPKNKIWNLCGHTHTKDKYLEMKQGISSYHVELDAHNMHPVSIIQIIEDIKNFNGQ